MVCLTGIFEGCGDGFRFAEFEVYGVKCAGRAFDLGNRLALTIFEFQCSLVQRHAIAEQIEHLEATQQHFPVRRLATDGIKLQLLLADFLQSLTQGPELNIPRALSVDQSGKVYDHSHLPRLQI